MNKFPRSILKLIREAHREALQSALSGTSFDRFNYAVWRAVSPAHVHLALFGYSEVDPEIVSERTLQVFYRLERIVMKRIKSDD